MTQERTYQFGPSRLTLRFGDITSSNAQVLVSSDDAYISMGGGVSASILRAGGEAIALDASKKVPAKLGDIVITTAGALPAQYVFHAITIGWGGDYLAPETVVEQATQKCMKLLETMQLSSIAFPAIGAGVAGFSYEQVAATMARVIADELSRLKRPVSATIYLFDRFGRMRVMDFVRFFEEFAAHSPRVAKNLVASTEARSAEPEPRQIAAETQLEYKRQRLHNVRRLLVDLEDQRGRLEQKLIALLAQPTEEVRVEETSTKAALKSNQELRLQYLAELQVFIGADSKSAPQADSEARPRTVFVSSTYRDLVEERIAVKDALARCDLFFRGMEHFGASPDGLPPASLIVEEVRKADAYLGIFGVRYGSIDPATGLSMTELEFREAEANKKPMLLYLVHNDAPVTVSDIETDPESHRKLAGLKDHILGHHVPYLFKSAEDLARQVSLDLPKLRKKGSSSPF